MTSRRRLYLERRRAARAAIEATQPVTELCAAIRSFFYGKQRAFFCGPAKRKATRKTRRAGATAGGCREFIARAVEYPKWRGTYVTTTRIEAKARAWESDTQSGLVDVIRAYGTALDAPGVPTYSLGGVTVEIREQELALVFSNGSRIELFGADDEHSLRKERGKAKHVIWIDEAQDFRWLTKFYKAVVVGCLTDFKGECWLSGTPGVDCVGMFYDITDEAGAGMKGWEVHAIAVVDNPFFGCVVWREGKWYVVDNEKTETGPFADEQAAEAEAVRVRWAQTARAALEENGWTEEDPDFQREWLARWVKTDARFVYAANAVADHDLCYAPVRIQEDGFPDLVAALADLPGRSATDARPREYVLVLGADLGTRDAFAFVVWAYSQLDPNLYELASWKRTGLDYDEMAGFLHAVQRQAYCGIVVADAGGGGKPAVMGWSKAWVDQYKLPITEAEKSNKPVAIKQLNNDIRHRRMRMRFGSPLLVEWRSHRWAPKRTETGSMVEDTTENHCADAGLYGHRHSYQFRWRAEDKPPPKGSVERLQREAKELEDELLA